MLYGQRFSFHINSFPAILGARDNGNCFIPFELEKSSGVPSLQGLGLGGFPGLMEPEFTRHPDLPKRNLGSLDVLGSPLDGHNP